MPGPAPSEPGPSEKSGIRSGVPQGWQGPSPAAFQGVLVLKEPGTQEPGF